MKRIYLAHPFEERRRIREWEKNFERENPHLELFNPFYDADRTDIDAIDRGEKTRYELSVDVVKRDLSNLAVSDWALAFVSDGVPSIGTIMEIVYAHIFRIPVAVIAKKEYNHPWIVQHAIVRFKSIEEFESWWREARW